MAERMTEFEVCERARQMLTVGGFHGGSLRVKVSAGGRLTIGNLTGVSPVNAWIKVGNVKIPAAWVTSLERE